MGFRRIENAGIQLQSRHMENEWNENGHRYRSRNGIAHQSQQPFRSPEILSKHWGQASHQGAVGSCRLQTSEPNEGRWGAIIEGGKIFNGPLDPWTVGPLGPRLRRRFRVLPSWALAVRCVQFAVCSVQYVQYCGSCDGDG